MVFLEAIKRTKWLHIANSIGAIGLSIVILAGYIYAGDFQETTLTYRLYCVFSLWINISFSIVMMWLAVDIVKRRFMD